MLENRSFDHMLGYSKLQGIDAESRRATAINGLSGTETNISQNGIQVTVSPSANFVIGGDPGHEFKDVEEQLCGCGSSYTLPTPGIGQVDPHLNNGGYLSNYSSKNPKHPEEVMQCFSPDKQLPILTELAREFVVCDNWFSSMPGPTWPNRFFAHAASAAGLDHSPPTPTELAAILSLDGYWFDNGTIFDRLDEKKLEWTVYHGDPFPQILAIKGMIDNLTNGRLRSFDQFSKDIMNREFSQSYVFIEPEWNAYAHFRCGNSQHPMDDVTGGEKLLKEIYETIRNSPCWENSLLIITYDEHGGFYDHVAPPTTVHPGDSVTESENARYNFNFQQLGVRVPTIVISPLIPKGTIDHRTYDHTSILSTIEREFELKNLTERDRTAKPLNDLLTLEAARTDTPATLSNPAVSGFNCNPLKKFEWWLESRIKDGSQGVDPTMAGFAHIALMRQIQNNPDKKKQLVQKFSTINTKLDAVKYLRSVRSEIMTKTTSN